MNKKLQDLLKPSATSGDDTGDSSSEVSTTGSHLYPQDLNVAADCLVAIAEATQHTDGEEDIEDLTDVSSEWENVYIQHFNFFVWWLENKGIISTRAWFVRPGLYGLV